MQTFMLIQNPRRKPLDYDALVSEALAGVQVDDDWSTGRRTEGILPGDRAFMLRVGDRVDHKGLLASGYFTSEVYEDAHWEDARRTANYADLRWDMWLHPEDGISIERLATLVPGVKWNGGFQASGNRLPPAAGQMLERAWGKHLTKLRLASGARPDEVAPAFDEGAVTSVTVNRYERDPRARAECIAARGSSCAACGFDFGATYGRIGKGYIEVHHVEDLSLRRRTIDPVRDLVPLCSNCHAMVHHGSRPARSVADLKRILRGRRRCE